MAPIDHASAELLVFTYREGPLSVLGHDLMLQVTRFEVRVTPGTRAVEARFDASSLRVVAGSHGGALRDDAFDEGDRRKIERVIRDEVLHADQHPSILFRSTDVTRAGTGHDVTGELTLHGVTRTIRLRSHLEGGRQTAEVTLLQPDYGIRPYTALLGGVRVKPGVRVRVRMQAP